MTLPLFVFFEVGSDCFEALDVCSPTVISVSTLCNMIPIALVCCLISVQIKLLKTLNFFMCLSVNSNIVLYTRSALNLFSQNQLFYVYLKTIIQCFLEEW